MTVADDEFVWSAVAITCHVRAPERSDLKSAFHCRTLVDPIAAE